MNIFWDMNPTVSMPIPSSVAHEGEDVGDLPRVHVIFLVTAQVDGHDERVVVPRVVIVNLDVLHLVESEGGRLPDLQDAILQAELLLLDEEVRHLPIEGVDLEEELVVYEILDGLLIVIFLKHAVDEGETENLTVEVLVDLGLGLTSHPGRQLPRGVAAFVHFELQVGHLCVVEVALEAVVFVREAIKPIDAIGLHVLPILVVEVVLPAESIVYPLLRLKACAAPR